MEVAAEDDEWPQAPPDGSCSEAQLCTYPDDSGCGQYQCVRSVDAVNSRPFWSWEEVLPVEGIRCVAPGQFCRFVEDETYGWSRTTDAICTPDEVWDLSGQYCEYQGPDVWCTDF